MPTGGLSLSAHNLMHLQTALLYPLELASTRIAADTAAKAEKRLYTGLLHCLQQTYYAEGPRGANGMIPVSMHCKYLNLTSLFECISPHNHLTMHYQCRVPW